MSVPTFRLKLDLFKLLNFDGARRIPLLQPDESRSARFGGCLKSSRSANATGGPITFLSRFQPARGQVLARVLGRLLFGEELGAALQ